MPFAASLGSLLFLGEVPRAVLRAGRAGAPSTPGGLGYLVVVRLIDVGRVCYGILDLCFEGGLSFLSVSIPSKFRPRTESDPSNFINVKIFSCRARLADGSLIEQTAL